MTQRPRIPRARRLARGLLVAAVVAVPLASCGTRTGADAGTPSAPSGVARTTIAAAVAATSPTAVRRVTFRPVVTRVTRADVAYSYAPGCPVTPKQLRNLRFTYWGFDGEPRRGTLVVASWAVTTAKQVFRAAFRDGFPIRKVYPVERYYRGSRSGMTKSDARSMRHDNTSAFNCRYPTGSSRFSRHSWGDAIDINPRENPHVLGGRTYPANGAAYANRGNTRPGMLYASSAMVRKAHERGWTWGGSYRAPDYQHLSRTGA